MFFNQFAVQRGGLAEVRIDLEHVPATLVEVADQTHRAEILFWAGQAAREGSFGDLSQLLELG